MGSTTLICSLLLLVLSEHVLGLLRSNETKSVVQVKDLSSEDYRLPKNVVPSKYTMTLTVLENFYVTKEFTGSIEIEVNVLEPTQTIKLHSEGITYEENDLYKITEIANDNIEMIVLTYNDIIEAGPHTIKIPNFKGILRTDIMYGFYLSSYDVIDGDEEFVGTTQFQATHARKTFPCFDEPEFKAVFDISISRPNDYISLANTKLKRTSQDGASNTIDHYEDTPPMSTYLIAFVVSKFKGYGETLTGSKDLVYDVFCREQALPTAEYSYYVGQKILNVLNEYTGIKYYEMRNTDKMHQVAIPDFSAGAMENWGLVTYRETGLLWDPEDSSTSYKSAAAKVIAHEFAHMWFGDLVTLKWWSDTWLNEGFARYFQYYSTKEVETTWELEKLFVVEQQHSVFVSDAVSSALPLSSDETDIYTPSHVSNKFATISYNKGACVIRMMNFIMGEEKFKLGIRKYLNDHQYENTVPEDLWVGLKTQIDTSLGLPEEFDVMMKTWTEQSGFPLITVAMDGANAVLTQTQFLYAKDIESSKKWYIPITFTTSHDKEFDKEGQDWMTPTKDFVISNVLHGGTGWILVNLNQNSYYRVNYEDDLWVQLLAGLNKNDFDGIGVINRAQIVDDIFNLARGGVVTYERALEVSLFLQNDVEYYPWYAAFSAYSYLRRRRGESEHFEAHIRETMSKLYESVSFDISNDDPHVTILKTALTLQWACDLGVESCLENANQKFKEYKDDNKKIDPNLRSVVYCSALRQSENKADWEFLWKAYESSNLATEKVVILNALGCTKDEVILLQYLKDSITPGSGIRQQDSRTVFNSVLAGNLKGVDVAYKFFTENIDAVAEYYGGMNDLSNIINGIADRFTTEEQINKFAEFAENNKDKLKDGAEQIANALENARANIKWAQAEFDDWLKQTYGSAASITLNMSLVIVVLTSVLYNLIW